MNNHYRLKNAVNNLMTTINKHHMELSDDEVNIIIREVIKVRLRVLDFACIDEMSIEQIKTEIEKMISESNKRMNDSSWGTILIRELIEKLNFLITKIDDNSL